MANDFFHTQTSSDPPGLHMDQLARANSPSTRPTRVAKRCWRIKITESELFVVTVFEPVVVCVTTDWIEALIDAIWIQYDDKLWIRQAWPLTSSLGPVVAKVKFRIAVVGSNQKLWSNGLTIRIATSMDPISIQNGVILGIEFTTRPPSFLARGPLRHNFASSVSKT